MTSPKIATLLASAGDTLGVRMTLAEEAYVRRCAQSALEARREMRQARRELERLAQGNVVLERMSESVGVCTACVLFATLGDPRDYHCGAAYRKGLGLNLKERSSGQQKGQLKITKRGPSAAGCSSRRCDTLKAARFEPGSRPRRRQTKIAVWERSWRSCASSHWPSTPRSRGTSHSCWPDSFPESPGELPTTRRTRTRKTTPSS